MKLKPAYLLSLLTGKHDSFGMPEIFMDTEKNTGRSGCAVRALAYCDLHRVRELSKGNYSVIIPSRKS